MPDFHKLLAAERAAHTPPTRIARKVFFLWSAAAFDGQEELQLELYESICSEFHLPLSSIRVVGSAQTGFSLIDGNLFHASRSDLDVAIVDSQLFMELFEGAFRETSGWREVNKFGSGTEAQDNKRDFLRNLHMGVIRPCLLPRTPRRARWLNFFGRLTTQYSSFCTRISAFVYAREDFMTHKQLSAINTYYANRGTP